jgi:hypothetical protein
VVVTFTMTASMLHRGMPRRPTVEMSAAMPVLAIVLLILGWSAILPMADLALLEHGLMMPVMLFPMVLRIHLYTGAGGHWMRAPARPLRARRHGALAMRPPRTSFRPARGTARRRCVRPPGRHSMVIRICSVGG